MVPATVTMVVPVSLRADPVRVAARAMNLYWIIGLTVFVYIEKILTPGPRLGRAIGLAMILWGCALIALG